MVTFEQLSLYFYSYYSAKTEKIISQYSVAQKGDQKMNLRVQEVKKFVKKWAKNEPFIDMKIWVPITQYFIILTLGDHFPLRLE